MINEQLLQYITKQRDAGTEDEKIKENLRAAGWKDEDIQEGFDAVAGDSNSPQSHQQMRKQAAQQNDDTTTETETDQTQASQNKTQPNANQQDAMPDTSDGNVTQPEKAQSATETNQPNTESDDQYREPVAEEDTQNATAKDPSRAANEDPTPLRTMEGDQKRAQGGGATTKNESSSQQKKVEMSDPNTANKSANKPKQASSSSGKSTTDGKQEMRTPNDQRVAKQKTQGKKSEPQKTSGHKQDRKPKSAVGPGSGSPDANQQSRQQRGKKGPVAKTGKSAGPKQAKQQPRQRSSQIQQARQQSSSSSVATIILSILGLILIGGGAAYAYVTYFQGPTASTNAQAAIQALADSESFQYRIGISKQSESSSENTLIIEGAVDTDPDTSAQTYYTIQGPQGDNSSPVTGVATEFAQYPQLDQRQQQSVQQALSNQQFLSVGEFQTTQMLGATEDSSGFSTQRFGASLNPSQLFDTYATIHQAVQGEAIAPDVANTLRDNLSGFRSQQGQMWVHPTSSVPYQLTVIGDTQNGETLQVNMQFKNHGQEVTEVTDTYEERTIASALGEYLNVSTQQPNDNSTSSNQTTSTPPSSEPDDGQTQSPTSTEPTDSQSEREMIRRQDKMRINDIQQIIVALRAYANNNSELPTSLSELAGGEVLTTIPRDPRTDVVYEFAVGSSGQYHIGAILRATSQNQLTRDENYNSEGSASNGFNGAAESCGRGSVNGSICYDRTLQLTDDSSSESRSASNQSTNNSAGTADKVVGNWLWSNGTQSIEITFNSDGSYVSGDGPEPIYGQYNFVSRGQGDIPEFLLNEFTDANRFLKMEMDPDRSLGDYDPSADYSDTKVTSYHHVEFSSPSSMTLTEANYVDVFDEYRLDSLTYRKQ